ncbi:TRAP transporter small permease [Oceanobacillus profundus]|uniref:TRAP transporter small permease n=1 Tax=Oceanobacillus TaxID=182709 RepID=UPI00203E5121|nr:TRAP transporter small permease [Oceanobacillus profundus]MCM3397759.1 TRAP transporter small permease [Oceanobacillus profundus]
MVINFIYKLSKILLAALIGAMTIVIIAQVLSRGLLNNSIFWAEEFSRYCFIWATFIGASVAYKSGEMVALDLIVNKISIKFKWLYFTMIELFVLLFSLVVLNYGIQQTFSPSIMNQVSPAIQLPMYIVYLSIPLGFGLICIYAINSIIHLIRFREKGLK